jgi:hypothetical protein
MKDKDSLNLGILYGNILNEAISLKTARKRNLTKKHGGAYNIDVLNRVFENKDRLVYDIDINNDDLLNKNFPLLNKLLEFFKTNYSDYIIPDKESYIKGFAYKTDDQERKRPYKIGKLLNSFANKDESARDILKAFNEDPLRRSTKQKKLKVVISRHPYDIAGMSTDRGWTSCMNLGGNGIIYSSKNEGINKRFVKNDIDHGTIIAYLVSDDDRHENGKIALRRPLARILLKPYVNAKNPNDYAYSVESTYGTSNKAFYDFVKTWVINVINTDVDGKTYENNPALYYDGKPFTNFKSVKKSTNRFSEVFFDIVSYRTDEKYFRNFDFNVDDFDYDSDEIRAEVQIEFSFPKELVIPKFRFASSDVKAKYAIELENALDLSLEKKKYYSNNAYLYLVESRTDNDLNLIRYEIVFNIPTYRDPDEKYQDMDYAMDRILETFEQTLKDVDFDDFDYKEVYKRIYDAIKKANPESETEEEIADITNKFNSYFRKDSTVPAIVEMHKELDEFNSLKPQFLKDMEYFAKLGQLDIPSFIKLINDPKFPEIKERIDKFSFLSRKIVNCIEQHKAYTQYPHINTDQWWDNILTGRLLGGEDYIFNSRNNSNHNILYRLVPSRYQIAKYHTDNKENPIESNVDIDDAIEWFGNILGFHYGNRVPKIEFTGKPWHGINTDRLSD